MVFCRLEPFLIFSSSNLVATPGKIIATKPTTFVDTYNGRSPGTISVTANRNGLTNAILKFESKSVEINHGLMHDMPQTLAGWES